jgi:lysophospholipase L1-like esterase
MLRALVTQSPFLLNQLPKNYVNKTMQRIFLLILSFAALYFLLSCKKMEPAGSQPVQPGNISYKNYLALGDSYSIGQSVAATERFPFQTLNILSRDSIYFNAPEYIAQTGWTTGNLINAISNTPPSKASYDFVTLLIGVNNQYQGRSQAEYTTELTILINKAIQYAGNNPKRVAVLSIPDWGVTPYANGQNRALIAREIDSFNVINKQIALSKAVNYIDITASTRLAATDLSLLANDGLHPSGKEYGKWSVWLAALIKSVL